MKNENIDLFITAFIQVFLVTANTFFISRLAYIGIALSSFLISYLWTLNVKRVSLGGHTERIIYSLGAMIGGVFGVIISETILTKLSN